MPHWRQPMLDAAALPLAPLLLWQGLRLRRTLAPLPEPPGPREGVLGGGAPLHLLILGDSAAAGVGAPHQEAALAGWTVRTLAVRHQVHWRVLARTGATVAGTFRFMVKKPSGPFGAVLVSLGVNDLIHGRSLDGFRQDLHRLLDHVQGPWGAATVILTVLPPMHRFPALPQPLRWHLGRGARRFDAVIQGLVRERPGCHHLALPMDGPADLMAADGFHPGPGLYRSWGQAAGDLILARTTTPPGGRP